jgi:hypothetical protein
MTILQKHNKTGLILDVVCHNHIKVTIVTGSICILLDKTYGCMFPMNRTCTPSITHQIEESSQKEKVTKKRDILETFTIYCLHAVIEVHINQWESSPKHN